jgi:hypothetical protein
MSFPFIRIVKGPTSTVSLRRYFSNRRRHIRSKLAGTGRFKRQQKQLADQEADPFSPAALRHRIIEEASNDDKILSSSAGARVATFLVLGIVPIVVFGVVVNSTPHLRLQLRETIDAIQNYASGSMSKKNTTKPEDQMEYSKKSDTR